MYSNKGIADVNYKLLGFLGIVLGIIGFMIYIHKIVIQLNFIHEENTKVIVNNNYYIQQPNETNIKTYPTQKIHFENENLAM